MLCEHAEEESDEQNEQLSQNFRYDIFWEKPDQYGDRPKKYCWANNVISLNSVQWATMAEQSEIMKDWVK